MASFLRDVNYQPPVAANVVLGTPLINQVNYDVNIDTSGGLYIGTGGTLNVVMAGDSGSNVVTYNNLPNGTFLPIQVKKVLSTSTCSNIIVFLAANPSYIPGLQWQQATFNWEAATINWN
jgi:hypothetical protein